MMTTGFEAPAVWKIAGSSARGASHVRRSLPNQDALSWKIRNAGKSVTVGAVSDGHGGRRHYRSGIGSRLAVTAALRQAERLDEIATSGLSLAEAQRLLPDMVRNIVADWTEAVLAHNADCPPEVDDYDVQRSAILERYGATLLVALAVCDVLILLQIGDGDLVVGNSPKGVWRFFPPDIGLKGEETYSLCLPEAEKYFRATALNLQADAAPTFVMLSTDGISKSFASDDEFLAVVAEYFSLVQEQGIEAIEPELDGWLSEVSRLGSGDDATILFIVRQEAPRRAVQTEPTPHGVEP